MHNNHQQILTHQQKKIKMHNNLYPINLKHNFLYIKKLKEICINRKSNSDTLTYLLYK
jgi:hypothetical protein